jgi:hypothetical protein
MKIIYNHIIPFGDYAAINLFGIIFCQADVKATKSLIQHELIHTAQMREMLYVGFYLWYIVEWLVRIPMKGNAYFNISFEREAYLHMYETNYLLKRKHFKWMKYIRRRKKR